MCVCLDDPFKIPLNALRSGILRDVYTLQCERGLCHSSCLSLIWEGFFRRPWIDGASSSITCQSVAERCRWAREQHGGNTVQWCCIPGKKAAIYLYLTLNRSIYVMFELNKIYWHQQCHFCLFISCSQRHVCSGVINCLVTFPTGQRSEVLTLAGGQSVFLVCVLAQRLILLVTGLSSGRAVQPLPSGLPPPPDIQRTAVATGSVRAQTWFSHSHTHLYLFEDFYRPNAFPSSYPSIVSHQIYNIYGFVPAPVTDFWGHTDVKIAHICSQQTSTSQKYI